jgi:zinc transporter 1
LPPSRSSRSGALINGVFLLALCFSIFLECIQRLVTVPEVTNPWVVVIVGSLGLLSNIVGLVLFHDVHGGGGHSHSHSHGAAEPSAPAVLAGKPAARIDADGHRRKDSLQSLFAHPALIRANVQATAEQMGYHQGSYKDSQGLDRALSPEGGNRRSKSHGGEREPLISVAEHERDHAGCVRSLEGARAKHRTPC